MASSSGSRAALGSPRTAILRLITGHGLRLVAGGIVLGLLAGAGLTRLMVFMLYGVSPLDATAFLSGVAVLALVGLLASWMPARRAAGADPMIALRQD